LPGRHVNLYRLRASPNDTAVGAGADEEAGELVVLVEAEGTVVTKAAETEGHLAPALCKPPMRHLPARMRLSPR